jgi:hypothetical protein
VRAACAPKRLLRATRARARAVGNYCTMRLTYSMTQTLAPAVASSSLLPPPPPPPPPPPCASVCQNREVQKGVFGDTSLQTRCVLLGTVGALLGAIPVSTGQSGCDGRGVGSDQTLQLGLARPCSPTRSSPTWLMLALANSLSH